MLPANQRGLRQFSSTLQAPLEDVVWRCHLFAPTHMLHHEGVWLQEDEQDVIDERVLGLSALQYPMIHANLA